jgi:methanogenic corrinoid protein MtbC1
LGDKEKRLMEALESLDKPAVFEIVAEVYKNGGTFQVGELLRKVLEDVGNEWEQGSTSLAQVYMDGLICEEAVRNILPENQIENPSLPRVGTAVFLDHHGLGMRIVTSLVRSAGYPVRDIGLGADVTVISDFVERERIDILLVSVLMLPSALSVRDLTDEMARRHSGVKVVVGGAPFRLNETLWIEVGAHRMGKNAGEIFGILQDLQKELP